MWLVADVGGTNTRIALLCATGKISKVQKFSNDKFASFNAVLAHFIQANDMGGLLGAGIAIAGPITSAKAWLTNRDWQIDCASVALLLALPEPGGVHLVNDLAALGYALFRLGPAQLDEIRAPSVPKPLNRQSLVVGVATGYNICVTNLVGETPVVNAAELGHANLSVNVYAVLQKVLGADARVFASNEHLFSGDGLSQLYYLMSQGDEMDGARIVAAFSAGENNEATRTVHLFAKAMGIAARELVFQYLPYGGINYAGSVARGILYSPARSEFLTAYSAPGYFDDCISMVPIRVISDDAAALVGVGAFAQFSSS